MLDDQMMEFTYQKLKRLQDLSVKIHDAMLERYKRPTRDGALHLGGELEWKNAVTDGDVIILKMLIEHMEKEHEAELAARVRRPTDRSTGTTLPRQGTGSNPDPDKNGS